jgi:hypothetical protein
MTHPQRYKTTVASLCLSIATSFASAQTLQPSFNGVTGYFHSNATSAPAIRTDGWGTTFYASVYSWKPLREDWTQFGSTTWMIPNAYEDANAVASPQPRNPDGSAFNFCPPNGILWQSMEGGIGTWGSVRIPTAAPMFIINATSNCYRSYITGPTHERTGERVLGADDIYFAQLSNRLLVPPGPILLENPSTPKLFGYGFIALPIIPANMSPYGIPTGRNSWTLFFNSEGFKGPVGFFTPAYWTAVNRTQNPHLSVGYGLDTRNAVSGSAAVEIGFTNAFQATDSAGIQYRRIPRMTFGVDANQRSLLVQDFRRYFRPAIWQSVDAWVNGGAPVTQFPPESVFVSTINQPNNSLRMMERDGSRVNIEMGTTARAATFMTPRGSSAFGIQWSGPAAATGTIPEYYKRVGTADWQPITPSEVPASTGLTTQTFPTQPLAATPLVDTGMGSPWDPARWAAGPFSARLTNESIVDYVWYRFIDQPALARLPLDAATRTRLQTWAESLHSQGLNALTLAPPTDGVLAALDPGQIVTPPSGMERGFVPIAIAQRAVVSVAQNHLTVLRGGNGSGSVASNPAGITCGATCTVAMTANSVVTLTATPTTGSTFAGWSGACTGLATCQVTMSRAQTVTASFSRANASVNYQGLFEFPGESGHGVVITQQAQQLFIAWYHFDAQGRARWTVTLCTLNGTICDGEAFIPTGSFFAQYDAARYQAGTAVGRLTVNMSDASNGTFTYNFGGTSGSWTFRRLAFGSGTPALATNYSGLWWGGNAQNGWGVTVSQDGGRLFGAWYTYDREGRATWYVMPQGRFEGNTYVFDAFRVSGARMVGVPYNGSAMTVAPAGTVRMVFAGSRAARWEYNIDGQMGAYDLSVLLGQ